MKIYNVGMQSHRHFTVNVKAKSKKEALEKAMDESEWLEEDTIENDNLKVDAINDEWEA